MVWAAILGSLVVLIVILNFGLDADSFRAGLRRAFEQILRIQTETPADAPVSLPGLSDPNRLIDVMVAIVPPAAAVLATITNLMNLWLAGRIVKLSGRLQRPWPDLSAMKFPSYAPILLAIGLLGAFAHLVIGAVLTILARLGADEVLRVPVTEAAAPGLIGIIGGVFAASLLMAYGVLGFAVLHNDHRRHERPQLPARRNLCGRGRVRLAGPDHDGARPCRHRARYSRPRGPQRCTARPESLTPSKIRPTDPKNGETNMEVILLERVAKLGQMGDVVRVKDGFARNFLLPKGKALRATDDNRKRFEGMKVQLETRNLELRGEAEKVAAKLDGQSFVGAAPGGRDRPALRLGLDPRPRGDPVRRRLQREPQPDRAQRADQDDRRAQGSGRAASGDPGGDQHQRRPQRRRGGAARARRGRDGASRGRR